MTNDRATMFNARSKRCINIALDLGIFGDRGFSNGIEDLAKSLPKILMGEPDVIQLNPGGLKIFQKLNLKTKTAVALRLDVTNVYEARAIDHAWDIFNPKSIFFAKDPRVAAIVLNLLNVDEDSRLQEQCIANIQQLTVLASEMGIPLMVEPLVMNANGVGSATSNGDVNKISALVRQAVELGADLIKVDPTSPMTDFPQVVEMASGIPVLVRGGGKVTPEELLERTAIAMESGAQGVVYGRNVVQHENPAKFIRAIAAIVHDNATVTDALKELK